MNRSVKFAVMVSAALAGSGCTAVIDQSSFFPQTMAPSSATLSTPKNYVATDRLFDLPGLGAIHAVFLDNPASKDVIIYHGGNGNFVADQSLRAQALADATGMDIVLYDYPGRGGTTIPATIPASLQTGPAFMKVLKDAGWIGSGKQFAYGLSFGGSQAAAMIRNGGFDGLIIEGSATDIAEVGKNFIPGLAKPFVSLRVDPALAQFDYYQYVVASKAPILLLSSNKDSIVTPRNMKAFRDRLQADGMAVELISIPGEHGTALRDDKAKAALKSFVSRR